MSTSLTFFEVTGHFDAVAEPSISGVLNTPVVQPVNALVTFTPRLPKGMLLYVSDYLVTAAYNAAQTVNLLGEPTGGTWTLNYGGDLTVPLSWSATPTQVQTALRNLAAVGNNVTVTADVEPLAYDVAFTGTLGNQEVPALVGDANLLTNAQGAGFCAITVTRTALGSPQVVADTAIALPTITARIFNGVLSTIDRVDTPGIELASNIADFGLSGDLIYDVAFSKVTYNGVAQVIAPFAFAAPADATAVVLSDPLLVRLAYQKPSDTMWTPGLTLLGGRRRDWRVA